MDENDTFKVIQRLEARAVHSAGHDPVRRVLARAAAVCAVSQLHGMGFHEPGENLCRLAELYRSAQQPRFLQSAKGDRSLLSRQCAAGDPARTGSGPPHEQKAEGLSPLSDPAVLALGDADRRCVYRLVLDLSA